MPSNLSQIPFWKITPEKLRDDLDGFADFACSNKDFADYLKVQAHYDQEKQVGQTWVFRHISRIVGFITIAMAHMKKSEGKKLKIDSYGNIPAFLIGHLATHKDFERRGIGRSMVSWAIDMAMNYSESIGCRLVILRPESDVVDFYKKLGFVYVPSTNDSEEPNMYYDLKE